MKGGHSTKTIIIVCIEVDINLGGQRIEPARGCHWSLKVQPAEHNLLSPQFDQGGPGIAISQAELAELSSSMGSL